MNTLTAPPLSLPQGAPAAARTVLSLLQRIRHGTLTLHLPNGDRCTCGTGDQPHATLVLKSWDVCAAALKSGDIGFAESYIAGDWSTPNLTTLLRVLVRNRREVEDVIHGNWAGRLVYRLRHLMRRNSVANSRKNIHAHYDLGNAFYELWLDDTMNYSSAWFDGNLEQPMQAAQHAKVRRALREAGVRPGDRVLEIGCGWGGFVETAARAGHTVTGISLSQRQTAYARERLRRAGLADRVELRLQDYRDLAGRYDAVASIEMFEAVGEKYWPRYFAAVRDALPVGGRAAIQTITIADRRFERYRTQSDFIQQHVFPGGMLASPSRFAGEARAAGLEIVDDLAFGPDYAETLKRWLAAFDANGAAIEARFDRAFVRGWRYYLAYCAAGFDTATTDVHQYTLVRR